MRLPDPHGLHRTVVEHVGFREVGDRTAAIVFRVAERGRGADYPLGRYAVELIGNDPHEVAIIAGCDVDSAW
jgi:hypothetical protein